MRKNVAPFRIKIGLFGIFLFLFLATFKANSQTVFYDSISKQKFAVVDVHKTYERVIEKGYDSLEMFDYLGNYYYKCKDFQKSKQYFDLLFKKYKLSEISQKSIELYKTL
jgi:lipoprotein NlpI